MKAAVFIVALLVIGIFCSYWLAGPDTSAELLASKGKVQEGASEVISSGDVSAAKSKGGEVKSISASSPASSTLTDREKIFQVIEAASITYDPAELPKIQPYLTHPDPEVRAEALNGIVNLGDEAGVPLLREAARRVPNSEESRRLIEMAEYLELPASTTKFLKIPAAKP